jgi:thiol:disulfide interchange protein DsbC
MVYLVFGCASIWKKGFDSIFPPEIQDKKRIDTSKIPLTSALVLGDLKAEKKVIIFADPDCPYCSNLYKVIKRIIDKRKDITFYIKMYPLKSHKDAYWKSKSIVCNNSLQMLQDCFDKKEIAKTDCKTDEVDNTLKLAKSLGITGTPAIILPDGRLRLGTMPETELTKLIDGKI